MEVHEQGESGRRKPWFPLMLLGNLVANGPEDLSLREEPSEVKQ